MTSRWTNENGAKKRNTSRDGLEGKGEALERRVFLAISLLLSFIAGQERGQGRETRRWCAQ